MTHGRSFLHSEYLRPSSLTFRCPHNSSNGTPQQTPPTPKHPIRPFLSTTLRCGGGRFVSQCRAPARVVCWLSPGRDASERLSACRGERESGPCCPTRDSNRRSQGRPWGARLQERCAHRPRAPCRRSSPRPPRGLLPEQLGVLKSTETSGCVIGPSPPGTILESILTAGGAQFLSPPRFAPTPVKQQCYGWVWLFQKLFARLNHVHAKS